MLLQTENASSVEVYKEN